MSVIALNCFCRSVSSFDNPHFNVIYFFRIILLACIILCNWTSFSIPLSFETGSVGKEELETVGKWTGDSSVMKWVSWGMNWHQVVAERFWKLLLTGLELLLTRSVGDWTEGSWGVNCVSWRMNWVSLSTLCLSFRSLRWEHAISWSLRALSNKFIPGSPWIRRFYDFVPDSVLIAGMCGSRGR